MLLLPRFQYHEPENISEACETLAALGNETKVLAGGTDLVVNMKKGVESPDHVVSIGHLEELVGVDDQKEVIRIGACHRVADVEASELLKGLLPGLAMGAESLGSPLVRNLATVGGNVVSARPAADLPPSLMAYGTKAVLRSHAGKREVLLEDFFKGPGQTVIQHDEILTDLLVPAPPELSGCGYIKLGVRKALEISIVNVAAFFCVDSHGLISDARVVLGSVAPTPIRAPGAEKVLKGEKPTQELFEQAGRAASHDSRPIDDFRASAAYRRDMVAVLTKRALSMAHEQIKEKY